MKKAILLGAISPFCDLVREMEALEIEPIVCDYYSDAPAKRMGHASYDISTMDVEALIKLAKEECVNGVVSAFSDRNLLPALEVCEKLKLNHFFSREIIDCMTDKKSMKAFFDEKGYPVVKYGVHNTDELALIAEYYDFPVLTKPLDAYGSKGIYICENMQEVISVKERVLKEAMKHKNEIIIEEFYCADEISVSAWVKKGKAYITCVYDVFRNFGDTVTLSAVSFPSKYTAGSLEHLDRLINLIVYDAGIVEGPVTLQCFMGKKGIKVNELLCRLAGGSPYLYATYLGGPNVAKMLIQNAVNEDIDYQNLETFKPVADGDEVFYDVQILVKQNGKIKYDFEEKCIAEQIPELVEMKAYYSNNADLINVPPSGIFFGRVICKTTRQADYFELLDRIEKAVHVYDESGRVASFIRRPDRFNVTETSFIDWGDIRS